ncbi:DMT family transporter [Pseudomonas asiatica]|uniref:DMT family transporter n=1 Tax=Pseudomonas asiatica TaxID=2219225 RepID=UPI00209AC116|nr:DMT family transporter [Pseudomonas asiatica]MCO7524864.1 DMT family transporter [Pseudomonas asiatica]
MTVLLYCFTVLIWGTTWIAISVQSEYTSPPVAIFWRMGISALLLGAILLATRKMKWLSARDHAFCLLQGATVFGINFLCFYTAAKYVNSGLECLIFSTSIFFNAINSWIFLKQRPSMNFFPAATLGVSGIFLLFSRDLLAADVDTNFLKGIGLCVLGTFAFSIGNLIGTRNQLNRLCVFTTTTYAMGYAALIMLALSLAFKLDIYPSLESAFLISLAHLAIFGSVVAFTVYFSLIGRIGSANAAYTTLLFPLVALTISTIYEGFEWTTASMAGAILIFSGVMVLFTKPGALVPRFQILSQLFSARKTS